MKKTTGGWVKITRGWYRYTNTVGKTLAYVEKTGTTWTTTVLPMADAARSVVLSSSPKTMAQARDLAELTYKSLTLAALKRERAELTRVGY